MLKQVICKAANVCFGGNRQSASSIADIRHLLLPGDLNKLPERKVALRMARNLKAETSG